MLGWIRLVRNAVRCWLGYVKSVRPALKRGLLIVGDRWMYGYVIQPDALKFYGPDQLARAVLRMLPRPHLIVNLTAPPSVIRERKQELTVAQIEQELLAWSSLRMPNVQTVDATRSPQDVALEILVMLRGYE
jgi:thymidylate kinase